MTDHSFFECLLSCSYVSLICGFPLDLICNKCLLQSQCLEQISRDVRPLSSLVFRLPFSSLVRFLFLLKAFTYIINTN